MNDQFKHIWNREDKVTVQLQDMTARYEEKSDCLNGRYVSVSEAA